MASLSPFLPRHKSNVILKEVPGGAILFSTETEVYFSLNLIGVRVWQLLSAEGIALNEVVARIRDDYPEVSEETIAADVRGLVDDLRQHGLVEPVPVLTSRE
jgi:hypothetical protein